MTYLLNITPELSNHLGYGASDTFHLQHVFTFCTQLSLLQLLEVLRHHPCYLSHTPVLIIIAFWRIDHKNRSTVVTCMRGENMKKENSQTVTFHTCAETTYANFTHNLSNVKYQDVIIPCVHRPSSICVPVQNRWPATASLQGHNPSVLCRAAARWLSATVGLTIVPASAAHWPSPILVPPIITIYR